VAAVGFLTDDQLGDAVARFCGYPQTAGAGGLYASNPRWAPIVVDSNKSAWDGLLNDALTLGYTQAQLLAWDLGADFQRDVGKFWSIQNAAGFSGLEPYAAKAFDRRAEALAAMADGLLTGGVLVRPGSDAAAGRAGRVSLGGGFFGDPDRGRRFRRGAWGGNRG
jgi:hypothetical protein